MKIKSINSLKTDISDFKKLKESSEIKWTNIELDECYGFQIQGDSKWNSGLSENEIKEFQERIGFDFPEPLKNLYRVMNGLNKLGINISGDLNNDNPTYHPTFYSYPKDLDIIKEKINWILQTNNITIDDIKDGKAPMIFPYFGHRFIIFDSKNQILSMHGNDIIPWAGNLTKAIATDIFDLYNGELDNSKFESIKYWLE